VYCRDGIIRIKTNNPASALLSINESEEAYISYTREFCKVYSRFVEILSIIAPLYKLLYFYIKVDLNITLEDIKWRILYELLYLSKIYSLPLSIYYHDVSNKKQYTVQIKSISGEYKFRKERWNTCINASNERSKKIVAGILELEGSNIKMHSNDPLSIAKSEKSKKKHKKIKEKTEEPAKIKPPPY